MSCTIIFYHDEQGETLLLLLRDAAGAVVNGEGDELTEGSGLRYAASVSEDLSGWYVAQIFEADGDLLYTGNVKVANDGGTYRIDDPQAGIPASAPTAQQNANAVWGSEERTLTEDVTAEVDPEQLGEVIIEVIGAGVPVASFNSTALAQLAGRRQIVVYHCGVIIANKLPIVQGDACLQALDSALEFPREDFPDLSEGDTAHFRAELLPDPIAFSIHFTGEIIRSTGIKLLRFERTSAQTALWPPGNYRARVEIQFASGEVREYTAFDMQVTRAIGRSPT